MNEKEICFRTTGAKVAYVAGVKRGTGDGGWEGEQGRGCGARFLFPCPFTVYACNSSQYNREPSDLGCHVEHISRSDVFEVI